MLKKSKTRLQRIKYTIIYIIAVIAVALNCLTLRDLCVRAGGWMVTSWGSAVYAFTLSLFLFIFLFRYKDTTVSIVYTYTIERKIQYYYTARNTKNCNWMASKPMRAQQTCFKRQSESRQFDRPHLTYACWVFTGETVFFTFRVRVHVSFKWKINVKITIYFSFCTVFFFIHSTISLSVS